MFLQKVSRSYADVNNSESRRHLGSTHLPSLMPTDRFPVTRAILSRTQVRLDKAVVGPNAGLRINTPVLVIAAGRNRGIVLGENELAFPAQRRAEIGIMYVETIDGSNHAAPPAAFMMARFMATRAS